MTVAADNVSNASAAWVVLALLAVLAICATLYQHERVSDRHGAKIADHTAQLATLAGRIEALAVWLGVEISDPVDDSPEALEAEDPSEPVVELELRGDDPSEVAVADTDEFPAVQPDTEPMPLIVDPTPAVQARRAAAWDDVQQRPSPVPRDEYETRTVNIGGTLQTFRIPARREDA